MDQEIREAIEEMVNSNPAITLVTIKQELQHRYPSKPTISSTTIAKVLNGMLFSLKKLHISPADRNRQDVKEARRVYARWFLEEGQLAPLLVFIDESGFNLWI